MNEKFIVHTHAQYDHCNMSLTSYDHVNFAEQENGMDLHIFQQSPSLHYTFRLKLAF
jgi:hypothetical protein